MRVFLTGGTGLLGWHVARLREGGGHEVVAFHRASSKVEGLQALGCHLVQGDLAVEAGDGGAAAGPGLEPAMEGCTHLVHAAARVYDGSTGEALQAVNVGGTRRVLEAAAQAGVGHAVHISSVAVYGADTPYARSKLESEEAARSALSRGPGPGLTILRPSALYGEGDRLTSRRLARLLQLPLTPLLGDGESLLPLVYAGNAAQAVVAALEADRSGATYDVARDHPLTQRRLLEGLARGLGRPPRFVRLPVGPLRVAAAFAERLGLGGAAGPSPRRALELATGGNPWPSEAARRELGWAPSTPLDEALERTGRWLREGGTPTLPQL